MTKLRRVLAISIFIVSLFEVAFAGDTLTPPSAPPPPAAQYTPADAFTTATAPVSATQSSALDMATTEALTEWLLNSIL